MAGHSTSFAGTGFKKDGAPVRVERTMTLFSYGRIGRGLGRIEPSGLHSYSLSQ